MNAKALTLLTLLSVPTLASPPAAAQAPGEELWSVPLQLRARMTAPTVGADGTIYVHSDDLKAIAPDGTVLWSVPLFGIEAVDVAPDGTIYTGSIGTVNAYNPDGSLKWSFTEPSGGQGIMAGPGVGPDGNIYVITDHGGLGAFALSPAGELLWNVPGFQDFEGRGESPLAMGTDRFYFAEAHNDVPACAPALGMLAAVSYAGDLLWCVALTEPSRPVVAPNGNVYVTNADSELRAYSPDGDFLWFFDLPLINSTIVGPSAGTDSAAFAFQTLDDLWAVEADGSQRWVVTIPQGNALHAAIASPDGRSLVSGAVSGSPDFLGTLLAFDPETSVPLWETLLPGSRETVSGPVAFSLDGSVVYVPISSLTASRLAAYQVREVTQSGLELSVTPVGSTTIPAAGGTVRYDMVVTNHDAAPRTFDLWTRLSRQGFERLGRPRAITLDPGASLSRTLSQRFPAAAAPGDWEVEVNVGSFPAAEATAGFTVEKLAQ